MTLESVIACPHCATAKMETMPTNARQFFYTCTGCGATLRPKSGDCCVFCSYGSAPCPPIQLERSARAARRPACALGSLEHLIQTQAHATGCVACPT
jgi:hypothetical protein